jgi:hypothetical protein
MRNKAPSLSDFQKFINKTKDNNVKKTLRKMCAALRKSDRSIASTTPVLPSDVRFFFNSETTMMRLHDVRLMPHVCSFIQWRFSYNDTTNMPKKDVRHISRLCTQTLMNILGAQNEQTLVCFMWNQFFWGQRHVFSYFAQARCLHTGHMVCNALCTQQKNAITSFLSSISSPNSHCNSVCALHTSVSFKQVAPNLVLLTQWVCEMSRALFGYNTTCVLVIRFKRCVRVLHDKNKKNCILFVLHDKSDHTFCAQTLLSILHAREFEFIEKRAYVDVTFEPQDGLYKL